MSRPVTVSLNKGESAALCNMQEKYNRKGSDIVRQALDEASRDLQLYISFLEQRSAAGNCFDPEIDGFNSPAFINTLFSCTENGWKTNAGIVIDCGLLTIHVPAHSEVKQENTQNRQIEILGKKISGEEFSILLQADEINKVELLDYLTGDRHPYRNFPKNNWPRNFMILINMKYEEENHGSSDCATE